MLQWSRQKFTFGDDFMLKAVIFDMDGLLIDSEQVTYEALVEKGEELGVKISRDFYCTMLGRSAAATTEIFKKEFGADFDVEKLKKRVDDSMDDRYAKQGVPVKKGAVELLEYLKSRGIARVVASSSERFWVEKLLGLALLKDYFDDFVCADDVENAKPSPEIFLKACQKAKVDPSQALVLEDSQTGILAASRAKIPVICVPDMIKPNEEYTNLTLKICDSLVEVKKYIEKV